MNATSVEEVRAIQELPLGQAKLMEFDYVELSPLTPLHMPLNEASASANVISPKIAEHGVLRLLRAPGKKNEGGEHFQLEMGRVPRIFPMPAKYRSVTLLCLMICECVLPSAGIPH